ncbi:MAG: hypothetical protein JXR46_14865 [Calditrichaceae bacterium]|nr:hypothetical protein [Calditrichaceae bacterium]MBN2710322.1 hypothetical protein [Calditrichaceae bacterium]RQV92174.1 MAG: hypothetical protein EH224_16315 [Calditrichota bacterium]
MEDLILENILKSYNELILELEEKNNINKRFVEFANQHHDDPKVIEMMASARENLQKLKLAIIERQDLIDKYLGNYNGRTF